MIVREAEAAVATSRGRIRLPDLGRAPCCQISSPRRLASDRIRQQAKRLDTYFSTQRKVYINITFLSILFLFFFFFIFSIYMYTRMYAKFPRIFRKHFHVSPNVQMLYIIYKWGSRLDCP